MTVSVSIQAGSVAGAVQARLAGWADTRFGERLWAKDSTLWFEESVDEIENRLGWLDLPDQMPTITAGLSRFALRIRLEGIEAVVVLGMGGSSLAPEVFQGVFGNATGHPRLYVLDSTHPAAVRTLEDQVDLSSTLFVVSSKSGTTLETLSFFRYFWEKVSKLGSDPARHFVAITDVGSSLDRLAEERGFRNTFHAPADVGGRYSALSEFGLVPAAAIGVDLDMLYAGAKSAADVCGRDVAVDKNPALILGAFLGEAARAGRDKATFVSSPALRPLSAWIEQLVAESSGKSGTGIVPIVSDEGATNFGGDRAIVSIEQVGEPSVAVAESAAAQGHPTAQVRLADLHDLGGAMFVLEMAVAAAGAVLEIHPFNQPDVQLAKKLARNAMSGDLDSEGVVEVGALDPDLGGEVSRWLAKAVPPRYVSIQAYLPPTAAVAAGMETVRRLIRDATGTATSFGFGPRFLHSTGQLHKGGPPGLFLQVVDDATDALAVPESAFTFNELIAAQSLGDYGALRQRGHGVLRIDLGDSGAKGLETLVDAVVAATNP